MYADILIITAFDGVFYTPLDIDELNFSISMGHIPRFLRRKV